MTPIVHAEPVMGTVVSFQIFGATPERAGEAVSRAVTWLHWVDATFSTYRHDSEICRLDRGELAVDDCHPDVAAILQLCEELRVGTGGSFDARAGGFLDPSGVVKGWSIERASAMLAEDGCVDHLVDGGGDVRLRGSPGAGLPWQVAITHPFQLDAFCAVIRLGEGAVATSGTYERGFHVFDPQRGRPATDLAAVTVVGPELTLTDAYATAAMAKGLAAPDWLEQLDGYEALVIDADGKGWESAGFARYRLDISPLPR